MRLIVNLNDNKLNVTLLCSSRCLVKRGRGGMEGDKVSRNMKRSCAQTLFRYAHNVAFSSRSEKGNVQAVT